MSGKCDVEKVFEVSNVPDLVSAAIGELQGGRESEMYGPCQDGLTPVALLCGPATGHMRRNWAGDGRCLAAGLAGLDKFPRMVWSSWVAALK